jgi:hypothetical protein
VDDLTATFSNLEIVVSNQEKKETYMSKNLTLKGLAFGALVALATSAVAPANAAGLADHTFVSLLPQTGTEYTVLADQTFDLKANIASTVAAGGNLKYQVVDASSQSRALAQSKFSDDLSKAATGFAGSGSVVTVTVNNTLQIGDIVTVSGLTGADAAAANITARVTAASATSFAYASTAVTLTGTATISTHVSRAAIIAGSGLLAEQAAIGGVTATSIGGTATTAGTLRTTAGTYVVSSETNTTTSDKVLRLISKSASTYSVKVTAWVDSNGDNAIDATEYASEERTVTFEKASDITAVTTLTPIVGDTTLTAKVTTTPTLNGQQVLAQAPTFLNAGFTRQGDASTAYAKNSYGTGTNQTSVWDDTNKYFSVVADLGADTVLNSTVVAGTTNTDSWGTLAVPTAGTGAGLDDVTVSATGLVTVITAADHKLLAGDKVTFAVHADDAGTGEIGSAVAASAVSVTVTGAKTFTFQSPATTPVAGTLGTGFNAATGYTVATWTTNHLAKADRVFAGDYTAQAYIAAVVAGAKVTASTAAAAASVVTASTTATAGVQGKSFTAVGTNTTKVKTGTTSVSITFAVTDVDGAAVTAGRPVVVTLSGATADTFKIDGKSTTNTVYTDAAGKATVTVTALVGNNGAAVTATAVAEGVASADIDLAWEDAAIGIADLSGTSDVLAGDQSVTRTIKKGGSYTLTLGAQDQFNAVADSAVYRFLVTGNGVTEAAKTLTAGKASVLITDTLGTTMTTTIALQKLSAGTWSAVNTWTVTTNLATTPALALGAKGVTTYGTAVVTSSPVAAATDSLVATDKRSATLTNPSYGSNYVLLNGAAQNGLTSVGVVGQLVTVSGPANVLFENGSVSAKGSLTFVSGASGLFEVKAYSYTAQTDSVITFTSEGVSKTIKISFTGVSVGSTNVLTAAAGATTVQAGRAVDYTATVVDAQGNAVSGFALKATLAGAGSFAGSVNSSGAVEATTDINGKLVVKVLYSSADAGTATVTFADNDASTATADNLKSVVLATEVGSTDANIDIVGKRVTAVTSFSKGKTVAFYVDGIKKWSKVSTSDADVVLYYNLKKGTHTVTVKVSGGFTTTEKFIVK